MHGLGYPVCPDEPMILAYEMNWKPGDFFPTELRSTRVGGSSSAINCHDYVNVVSQTPNDVSFASTGQYNRCEVLAR